MFSLTDTMIDIVLRKRREKKLNLEKRNNFFVKLWDSSVYSS